jgi:hypothetical protein
MIVIAFLLLVISVSLAFAVVGRMEELKHARARLDAFKRRADR